MSQSARVRNISQHLSIKRSQAYRRVEQCISAWVEIGVSIRDLTLPERIQARAEQAKLNEPMPFAELPGLIFQHGDGAQIRMERQLAAQANRFADDQGHVVFG